MPQIYNTQQNYSYKNVSTAATTVVKAAPGVLHRVTVNNGTFGTIALYDNASAASGTLIGTITPTAAAQTWVYDVATTLGLTMVAAANTDITVIYL